jgi:3D (Asp-Asp-Asp) domain-containing protein
MSIKTRRANLRYIRIFRILAIILGFWCTIHFAHRECAIMADKPLQNKALCFSSSGSTSSAVKAEEFEATAYCVTGISKSGTIIAPGHVAADPKVIPLGSMIYVDSPLMGGIYQVLDTGELVKGKIIDIFIPSYESCKEFGRRAVKVKVLRYGFLGHRSDGEMKK